MATADPRERAIAEYRKKINEHRQIDAKLKEGTNKLALLLYFEMIFNQLLYHLPKTVRESLKELNKQYEKSENDLKALQSVGQIVGEVLKQLTEDNCE